MSVPPPVSDPPVFDDAFRAQLRALLSWRRDVRRFRPDPLPEGTAERLVEAACLAPSVGLSEPWRFAIVEDEARRARLRANFARCNAAALAGQQGARAALYAGLKLSGMDTAPLQLAVLADPATEQGHGLGRRTMPETVVWSAVTAVHTLWLAARAEGLGVGWVSILDPDEVCRDLDVPAGWRFVAWLCIGWPEAESETPALQAAGWAARGDPRGVILRR